MKGNYDGCLVLRKNSHVHTMKIMSRCCMDDGGDATCINVH